MPLTALSFDYPSGSCVEGFMCSVGYRFRLSVSSQTPGLIRLVDKETSFLLPDERTAYVVARDSDALQTAKKLHIEAGSYETADDARTVAEQLRLSLRVVNAMVSLGLEVPTTDKIVGGAGESRKAEAKEKFDVVIMDDVRGVLVFPDDERHAERSVDVEAVVHSSDTTYWFNAVQQLMTTDMDFDERAEDAISFLNMATLETTLRSSFLLTYLALERLIPTSKRDDIALGVVEELKEVVVRAGNRDSDPIGEREVETLLGSVGRLQYESFGSALKRIATENEKYEVDGVPLADFVRTCTSLRHATAHASSLENVPDYQSLTRGLRRLAIDILWTTHKIRGLSFHRPGDSFTIPEGGLTVRLITYERR